MDMDTRRLLKIENVNYRRAQRLLRKFGSYEDVMSASYQQLIETHYIGEKTAMSIYNYNRGDPGTLV